MAASLNIVSFDVTPLQGSGAGPCTIEYQYRVSLDKVDVHDSASQVIREKIAQSPDVADSRIDYAAGKIFLAGASSWEDVVGKATVEIWGQDAGGRDFRWYKDNDDLKKANQDAHDVPCKEGTQTSLLRPFAVTANDLNEDAIEHDEIYVRLTIVFPSLTLTANSPVKSGRWSSV